MKKTILSLLVGFSVASQAFADDLYQVYEQALAKDPTVNRAKAQRDAAYSGISISRAALLPQLSGSLSWTDGHSESPLGESFAVVSRDTENIRYSLNLDMTVYDHSQWLGLDRAELVAHQSDATLGSIRQDLIVRTTTAYLNILRALDNLDFVRAEKRAIERQLEQTKQRFEVGLTAITDVHEAQANYDNTVAQEIRAQNEVELRREELREITGKYHDRVSVLNTQTFDAPSPNPVAVTDWLKTAEDENLDLLVRKFDRDIAEEDVELARAGHLPTVTFNANASRDNTDLTVLGQESELPITNTRNFGFSINVPIYQGGRVNSQTEQARHNYVAASENLELTHRSTVRQVRSSYNDVIAAISTIKALQQSVVSAESALKATEAGFEVGTRTIVDVLDSTRNLFDARRNLAGARYDYITAVVALKRAAGNLNEQDLADINRGLSAPTAS